MIGKLIWAFNAFSKDFRGALNKERALASPHTTPPLSPCFLNVPHLTTPQKPPACSAHLSALSSAPTSFHSSRFPSEAAYSETLPLAPLPKALPIPSKFLTPPFLFPLEWKAVCSCPIWLLAPTGRGLTSPRPCLLHLGQSLAFISNDRRNRWKPMVV